MVNNFVIYMSGETWEVSRYTTIFYTTKYDHLMINGNAFSIRKHFLQAAQTNPNFW